MKKPWKNILSQQNLELSTDIFIIYRNNGYENKISKRLLGMHSFPQIEDVLKVFCRQKSLYGVPKDKGSLNLTQFYRLKIFVIKRRTEVGLLHIKGHLSV